MGETRFLTRFAAGALAVAITAGGGLLIGGVANAAPSAGSPAVSAALSARATTDLIVAPNSFPQGLPVSLVAIVTPRAAAGTVQFKDGDTNIGDPVAVHSGTSVINGNQVDANSSAAFTLTSTLTAGAHSLTAVFTPTDPEAYSSSTSQAESLTVTPPITIGLPISMDSLLQSVLGGLPVDPAKLVSQYLNVDLGPIFGGQAGGGVGVDPGQIIHSVLGGPALVIAAAERELARN